MENTREEMKNELEKIETNSKDKKNKVVKNIVYVALSNILTLLAGILVGFALPKIMSKADYGYYKTFTLYFGYVGLFHMGFIDGIYLLYAGIKYDKLDKERFRLYSKFLIVFQSIIAFLIIFVSIPFLGSYVGVITLLLGVNLLFQNVTSFYQFVSQVTGRFKELSLRNVIKAILTSVSVIALTLLYYFDIVSCINYTLYILSFTSIQALLVIWYMYTYRDITFGKSKSIKDERKDIFNMFVIGAPLMVANLVSSLILTIDRQFVSIFFDIETYATYAFSYNMLSLITTIVSAISTVLYPTIKTYTENQLKENYNRLTAIIAIVVGFCVGAYYPLKFILDNFLPNYIDSLPIFRVILPGLLISSSITIIMFNYYKALMKQGLYFIISLIILVVSIGANVIAYLIFKTTISISVASVIVMVLWYIIVENLIIKRFKINTCKNVIYIACIITSFYILTRFVNDVFIGFSIYFIIYVLLTFAFYLKMIKSKFKSF